jgi:hypothetical protein
MTDQYRDQSSIYAFALNISLITQALSVGVFLIHIHLGKERIRPHQNLFQSTSLGLDQNFIQRDRTHSDSR